MKKILISLFFLIFLQGCFLGPILPFVVSPIISGITIWNEGLARRFYNEDALTLYRATKMSLKELNYVITKEKKVNGTYYLLAGKNDYFKIYIREVKPHVTEVSIRVNFMGDKPYAELVYNQIDLNTYSIEFDSSGKPTKRKI